MKPPGAGDMDAEAWLGHSSEGEATYLPFRRASDDRGESSSPEEAEKRSQSGVPSDMPAPGVDPGGGRTNGHRQVDGEADPSIGEEARSAATAAAARGGRSGRGDSFPSPTASSARSAMS
ncbi:hypothetical protein PVAP13_5KG008424 [Panicum virgatum]|uniref:Uncharacterized protein n=1 Tax=Panicum virgatum TaxID=38727 RepID=A0A8T0S923_PANVG|nr:hypothetical protein PVAP13_5KG008424 [Panicum virgatum]